MREHRIDVDEADYRGPKYMRDRRWILANMLARRGFHQLWLAEMAVWVVQFWLREE